MIALMRTTPCRTLPSATMCVAVPSPAGDLATPALEPSQELLHVLLLEVKV
jgi:hypothetical protein